MAKQMMGMGKPAQKTTMPKRAPQPVIPPTAQLQPPSTLPNSPRPMKAAVSVNIGAPAKPSVMGAMTAKPGMGAPMKPATPQQYKAGRMGGMKGVK